jgi:hypothetical protein
MDFIGFDLGKVSSQICIITSDGKLIERRIKSDHEHIAELLGSPPPALFRWSDRAVSRLRICWWR